jgi:glycosyltransferase involved in cell wall biosynthesis
VSASSQDARAGVRPRVVLVDWTHCIEDFLESLQLTFAEFCSELTGGWMFGYIDALRQAGVDTTLYCFSRTATTHSLHLHQPTGATIRRFAVPALYRTLRRRVLNPYAATVDDAVGTLSPARRLWWRAVLGASPYLATPVRDVARALREDGCDAVLCQEYENPRFDLLTIIGRGLSLPVFGTFQGGDTRAGWLERAIRPWTLRRAAGVIVASETERARLSRLRALPSSRVHPVFNPVDASTLPLVAQRAARQALQLPEQARIVAWHGRLNWHRKGLDQLLSSWTQVCAARPDGNQLLLLMGTGGDTDLLRAAVASLPPARVRWIDRYVNDRREISRFLCAADLYAFPSRHEGQPVAPIEALVCGLPVVGARGSGIEEVFGDGPEIPGVLVPPNDAESLATALCHLLDSPLERVRLGEYATARARDAFSSAAVGAHLRRILVPPNPDREHAG